MNSDVTSTTEVQISNATHYELLNGWKAAWSSYVAGMKSNRCGGKIKFSILTEAAIMGLEGRGAH